MKLLLTSDWHETPFARQKFETQEKNLGEIIIQIFGGKGKEEVMRRMRRFIDSEEIKIVINNGDIQENVANERGILTAEDLDSAKNVVQFFEAVTRTRMYLNTGNHESGYSQETLPLATDSGGGVTLFSIANSLKLIGRPSLYHSVVEAGYRLAFIPYVLTEKVGRGFDIEELKVQILTQFEADLEREEEIILFIHDPDSFLDQRLTGLVGKYQNKISRIFFGHCHAEFSVWLNKWLARVFSWKSFFLIRKALRLILNSVFNPDISRRIEEYYKERIQIPDLIKRFEAQLIPAPGGMLGFGGGFLVIDLETLEVESY